METKVKKVTNVVSNGIMRYKRYYPTNAETILYTKIDESQQNKSNSDTFKLYSLEFWKNSENSEPFYFN